MPGVNLFIVAHAIGKSMYTIHKGVAGGPFSKLARAALQLAARAVVAIQILVRNTSGVVK